jgi:hypothetical protein
MSITFREADGGANYFASFANGLPSVASFFPSVVWLEAVENESQVIFDRTTGINTYLGMCLGSSSSLTSINNQGLNLIAQHTDPGDTTQWLASKDAAGSACIKGWHIGDEIDMTMGPTTGIPYLQNVLSNVLPTDDGRFSHVNFGKGVAFWESDSQASSFVNLNGVDVISIDLYWFCDDDLLVASQGGVILGYGRAITSDECRLPYNYGITVKRSRDLLTPKYSKPIWNYVEVGYPSATGRCIPLESIGPSAWHSIIAGARGIEWFNHSFAPCPLVSAHTLRDYPTIRSQVQTVTTQLNSYAPIINASFVEGLVTCTDVAFMVKWYDGHYYIFAGAKNNNSVNATFDLTGIGSATAVVLEESRSITFTNTFQDNFADKNAIHIYRLDLNSIPPRQTHRIRF